MQRQNVKLRLAVADKLHCTLSDIGRMTLAEFNLIVAGYVDRAPKE